MILGRARSKLRSLPGVAQSNLLLEKGQQVLEGFRLGFYFQELQFEVKQSQDILFKNGGEIEKDYSQGLGQHNL